MFCLRKEISQFMEVILRIFLKETSKFRNLIPQVLLMLNNCHVNGLVDFQYFSILSKEYCRWVE